MREENNCLIIAGEVSSEDEAEEVERIAEATIVGWRIQNLSSKKRVATEIEAKTEIEIITEIRPEIRSETKIAKLIDRFCEFLHL